MDRLSLFSRPLSEVHNMLAAVPRGHANPATRSKVISEDEFFREALDFANTGSVRKLAIQVNGIPMPNGPINDPGWQKEVDRIARENFAADCKQFQADLVRVISNSTDASMISRLDVAARIFKIPQRLKGKYLGDIYIFDGLSAATSHAVNLSLDPAKTFRKGLHRCQWNECQRFFQTSDAQKKRANKSVSTGLPRTKYCSDECMFKMRAKRRKEK